MFSKLLTIIIVSGYLIALTKGLTIRELSAEDYIDVTTTSSVTESSYRKSVAKIQETPYRVPEHLQFVPKGFIYEDAADVIHVIDPPKHFEELKKIMQRQEQRQLQNLRPIALREYRPRPKIVKTLLQAKHKGELKQQKHLPELDMQIQETQQLPSQILASVRKTEHFLRKYKPKLPSVKQRLTSHKTQTVIWEQQQEQQQLQQGQEQRLQGIREQTANRKHFNIKRFKRDTRNFANKTLKGEELLNHINELIKNASAYLKQTENYDDYADVDLETTTLQGEILVRNTKTPASNNALNEDMVVKILENSVKATNVIMQQIKTQTNLTSTITKKCDYLKVTYPNHVQNLQNQIKCMQDFIKEINQTQQQQEELKQKELKQQQQQQQRQLESLQKLGKKYGERLELRKTKDLKHKPFLIAQLADDYIDDAAPSPVNSTLIYDDVMTTIRNMLQSQNLQSIEDVTGRAASSWDDSLNDSSFTYDMSTEPIDFHNLKDYLTSLENIVTSLPKFSHKSLNLQEIEGGSTSKYYFINPQGTIYSLPQPFQKDVVTTPPTMLFRQYQDLPFVAEYLKNDTISSSSSKVVETL